MKPSFALVGLLALLLAACGEDGGVVTPPDDDPPPMNPCVTQGCWSSMPALPDSLQDIQPVAIDGKIYVVGGIRGTDYFADGAVRKNMWVFDVAGRFWEEGPSFPGLRFRTAAAAVGKNLYVCGGIDDARGRLYATEQCHVYETEIALWSALPSMPANRSQFRAIAFEEKIYFFGGRVMPPGGIIVAGATNRVEVYNPQAFQWEAGFEMPQALVDVGLAVVDSLIYVIGGRTVTVGGANPLQAVADVHAYAPASETWYTRAPLPSPRADHGVAVLDGKIYVMGGELRTGFAASSNDRILTGTLVYDPAAEGWSSRARLPQGIHGTGAVTVGDRIYLPGGATRAFMNASDRHFSFSY